MFAIRSMMSIALLFGGVMCGTGVAAFDAPDHVVDITLTELPFDTLPNLDSWGLDVDGGLAVFAGTQMFKANGDGSVLRMRPVQGQLLGAHPYVQELVPAADQGWFMLAADCGVVHVDANAVGRWRTNLSAGEHCWVSPLVAHEAGAVIAWRATNQPRPNLSVIGLDGQERRRTSLSVETFSSYPMHLSVRAGMHHVGVVRGPVQGRYGFFVVAVDAQGQERWQWASPLTESLTLAALSTRASGVVDVASVDDFGTVRLHVLDAHGGLLTQRSLAGAGGFQAQRVVLDSAGGYALGHVGDTDRRQLRRFTAGTHYLWSRDTPVRCGAGLHVPTHECARLTPDGGVLLIGRGSAMVERWSSDGVRRLYRDFTDDADQPYVTFALAPDADRTVIAARGTREPIDAVEYRERLEWWRDDERIARVRPDWNTVPLTASNPVALAFGDDDHVLLAATNAWDRDNTRLIELGADGTIVSDRVMPEGFSWPTSLTPCGSTGSICVYSGVSGQANVGRFDPGAAAPAWSLELPPAQFGARLLPRDDGGLDVIRMGAAAAITPPRRDRQLLTRVGAAGDIEDERIFYLGDETGVLLNGSRSGHLVAISREGRMTRINPDDSVTVMSESLPRPFALDAMNLAGAVGDDGRAAYVGAVGDIVDDRATVVLVDVAADGTAQHTVLGEWPAEMDRVVLRMTRAAFLSDGDVLVVVDQRLGQQGRPLDGDHLYLARVSKSGGVVWQRRWTGHDERDDRVLHNAADHIVVSSRRGRGAWVLRMLDGAGQLLDQREIHCAGATCSIAGMGLSDEGRIIGVHRTATQPRTLVDQVLYVDGMDSVSPLPLDAPGIDGTWFNPAQGGQGFGLSRYPQGGGVQVFMPWFTFARAGGNDPGQLRWHTVQGDATAGTTVATLDVLENVGGRFSAPPATAPRRIGVARLRFLDCRRGLLEYRLDSADGIPPEGSIALRRLLPGTGACADGPDVGIDRVLTGNWYDPAQAGQGLDLNRVQVNGGALLFGAWYTFDPAAPVGEAADQHWYTLQGESIEADGSIATTIVQTLGGRFDGEPTENHSRVGTAILKAIDCRRLLFSYWFDESAAAGTFAGLDGQLSLSRLGACD